AVSLARDDRNLWDSCFGEGVKQLRAMADDAAVFLLRAGQESGYVFKGDEWDVERVAEAHEARALHAGVDVEDTRQERGLVGDDADRASIHSRESDHDVLG